MGHICGRVNWHNHFWKLFGKRHPCQVSVQQKWVTCQSQSKYISSRKGKWATAEHLTPTSTYGSHIYCEQKQPSPKECILCGSIHRKHKNGRNRSMRLKIRIVCRISLFQLSWDITLTGQCRQSLLWKLEASLPEVSLTQSRSHKTHTYQQH